jgi:2-amino-4-hydroxy-6-hydroxymethyldihydropteridine diphosphokinase
MDNLKFASRHVAEREGWRAFAHDPKMPTVYLSLGSNLGNREGYLRRAIAALPPSVQVRRVSSIYETEPVDYLDQPWFLNCVLEAETALEPPALLEALRSIEAQLGGQKEFAKGPRKIDLDILLYGDETIATPELEVPHPRMLQRRFVLTPLAELAPELKHPAWEAPAAVLLERVTDPSQVRHL